MQKSRVHAKLQRVQPAQMASTVRSAISENGLQCAHVVQQVLFGLIKFEDALVCNIAKQQVASTARVFDGLLTRQTSLQQSTVFHCFPLALRIAQER
jgi:hypothetical protein